LAGWLRRLRPRFFAGGYEGVTQGALEAVKKNDTDRLEEALSQRKS